MAQVLSAGLLMYRRTDGVVEVLLVHPGGPFWAKKDFACWSFPKGESKEGEQLIDVAKREFEEETGLKPEGNFIYVGSAQRTGKTVEAWMFEGDCDTTKLVSNKIVIEWPPRSGKKIEIPECDRGEFFAIPAAKERISKYLLPIIEAFEKAVL